MASKFISFNKPSSDEGGEVIKNISLDKCDLMNLAISFSKDSSKILEEVYSKNSEEYKKTAIKLKDDLDLFLSKIEIKLEDKYKISDNLISPKSTPFIEPKVEVNKNERELENGGMAPIKNWKSITELSLKNSDKDNLIEEMRRLSLNGKTVEKTTRKDFSINIEDFTTSFTYLENVHDYNGSFLIKLLKSPIEIENEADRFKVDLSDEKKSCTNGDLIILHIYDINSSLSEGEEKKFLLTLNFDKLNGVLNKENYNIISINNKKHKLSNKQLLELKRFCTAKKIN